MTRRTALASALLVATLSPAAGCWLDNPGTPLLEAEDVRMEPPGSAGFRQAGDRGEVYELALEVSTDVNAWVTEVAVGMSRLVHELDQHPPTRTDGDLRIYGPHDDEDGQDASWMVKVSGDVEAASFEVFLGRRGAASEQDMKRLIAGDMAVRDTERSGELTIDFDVIHEFADVMDDVDADADFGGSITVTFDRDTDTRQKRIELGFDGFYYRDAIDDFDYDGETYVFDRDARGAGQFHFATWSSFDDSEWSGPELERMTVDMRWDEQEAGRARGRIVEVDGVGDLRHGDIEVSECFDAQGGLTWRFITEIYGEYEPDYAFGEPRSCVFTDDELALPQ